MQSFILLTLGIILNVPNTYSAPILTPPTSESVPSVPIVPGIWLFPHENFEGVNKLEVRLDTNECYTLSGDLQNDYFSSIKIPTGTCIKLFVDEGCRGKNVTLETDHPDFKVLGINDSVTSLRKCEQNEQSSLTPSS